MDKYHYLKNGSQDHTNRIILNRQIEEESERENKIQNYMAQLRNEKDSLGHEFNNHVSPLENSDLKEWAGL